MTRVTQSCVLGFRIKSPSHVPATLLKSVAGAGSHWRVGAVELQPTTRFTAMTIVAIFKLKHTDHQGQGQKVTPLHKTNCSNFFNGKLQLPGGLLNSFSPTFWPCGRRFTPHITTALTLGRPWTPGQRGIISNYARRFALVVGVKPVRVIGIAPSKQVGRWAPPARKVTWRRQRLDNLTAS